MNTNNHQKAEKIYADTDPARQSYLGQGYELGELRGVLACTVTGIEAHLDLVDEVSAEFGLQMDASKFEIGISREKLVAAAEAKRKNYKKRAGVRALEAKYGHEAAARIVKKHSGRTIR